MASCSASLSAHFNIDLLDPIDAIPSAGLPTAAKSKDTSFYSNRYKWVTVTSKALYSIMMSLFYKVMSLSCGLMRQKESEQKYKELTLYHRAKLNGVLAYARFGKKIINFAVNCTKKVKKVTHSPSQELECLHKIYGEQFSKKMASVATSKLALDLEKLKQREMGKGICLGMTFDFISRFLHKDPKTNTLEAIKEISQLYTDGGTAEAEITQILSQAQDAFKLRRALIQEIFKQIPLDAEALNKFQADLKEKVIGGEKTVEEAIQEAENFAQDLERVSKVKFEEMGRAQKEIETEGRQALAKINHLTINPHPISTSVKFQENAPSEHFRNSLTELSDGAYYLSLYHFDDNGDPMDKPGHAMAFIKTSTTSGYLFDPNFATVELTENEDQTEIIWKLLKDYYNKEGSCQIEFFRMTALQSE